MDLEEVLYLFSFIVSHFDLSVLHISRPFLIWFACLMRMLRQETETFDAGG